MKKYIVGIILLLGLGGYQLLGADLTPIQKEIKDKPYLKLKATKDKILYDYEIIDENLGKIKKYDYISNKKAIGEFIFNGRSYTNAKVLKKDRGQNTVAFYVGDHFYKEGNNIYEIEHGATTTIEAFNEQTKVSLLEKIKGFVLTNVLAIDYYSDSGDGRVYYNNGATWSTARDAVAGTTATNGGDPITVTATEEAGGNQFDIGRVFLPIDTRAIPDGSTYNSAILHIYATAVLNTDDDGNDYLNVVQTSQAASSTLVTTDFDNLTFTAGGENLDITGISTSAYNSIYLNSTGINWIKTATQVANCGTGVGFTCLGVLEGHDLLNDPIANSTINEVSFSSTEHAGTSQDPYLEITFSSGTSDVNNDIITFW